MESIVQEFLSKQSLRSQGRTLCPVCGPERRKKNDRSLSVKLDGDTAIYHCHHCEISGAVQLWEPMPEAAPPKNLSPLSGAQLEYLDGRGISGRAAEECGLISGEVYVQSRGKEVLAIGWVYRNADGSQATKWRDGTKSFTQTGAARSLWRIDQWDGGDLIICEGEMDATSFAEIGVFATSVPNGAPSARVEDLDSTKFSYLWDAQDAFKRADRVILATDGDAPGKLLSEEIARRVGKARCWQVEWPDGCKDANDTLIFHGEEGLRKALDDSTPWPVSGLRDASAFREKALDLFRDGMDHGVGIGLLELDMLYRTNPQTLTVWTGIPGSGKTAIQTWMAACLADKGWNVAVFSAETPTEIHLLQLAACHVGKPYEGVKKMSEAELGDALDWVDTRFVFLDESETNISSILDRAHAAVMRNGVRLLVIDPYNFISLPEEGVGGIDKMLVSLKNFCVEHGVAIWLTAHPQKQFRQHDGSTPPITGYSISGSAGFFNTADAGLTVSRLSDGKTMVSNWKSRFPWVGKLGDCILDFDFRSGVFSSQQFSGGSDDGFDDF